MLLNSHMRARIKRHATAFKAELHAATLFDFLLSAALVAITNSLIYAVLVK